jgi:hypothetical protein
VVAPDRHAADVADGGAGLAGELRDRAVVVEARHRGEALARHVGGAAHRDQRVGVGGVADHQHAHVVGRAGVDRLPLGPEDAAVGLEQVAALHALAARPGADQQREVRALEGLGGVVVDVDPRQQRERAVVELHRRALGRLDGLRDLQQPEVHRALGAEHLAGRDPEQDRVADRAGGAGDGDCGGGSRAHRFISSITASANCEVPTAVGSSRVGLRS